MKSGWAAAVLIADAGSGPTLIDVRRIELADPDVPDSRFPFHARLERQKAEGARETARLVKIVERFAGDSLRDVLRQYKKLGGGLTSAGVVVGSQVDPATIKGDHIRAHAEEGRLFRTLVLDAVERFGLKATVFLEKDLYAAGSAKLRRAPALLKKDLSLLGKGVAGPWRSDEKGAALAALIALK